MRAHYNLVYIQKWNELTSDFGPVGSGQPKWLENGRERRVCHASAQLCQNKPMRVHILDHFYLAMEVLL